METTLRFRHVPLAGAAVLGALFVFSAGAVWAGDSGTLADQSNINSLPSHPDLPDPLVFSDGRPVKDASAWAVRRKEILGLFHQWVVGAVPPPPGNVTAEITSDKLEGNVRTRKVRLSFGPGKAATLRVELITPVIKWPHPVFLTQWNHRAWGLVAVTRGYAAAIYAGSDGNDDTEAWKKIWPNADWSTLVRRAWGAARVVDWLATLRDIDAKCIGITGHSRNGKQSLYAAALDERIAAVAVSSAGQGGSSTFREFHEGVFGEGIETITANFPDWFHPRLRSFAGREDRLPVDINDIVACVAPRPCLLSVALNDPGDAVPAVQHSYLSARGVYELLGAPDRLRVLWRPGAHETRAREIERYVDWFDAAFGRGKVEFPEVLPWPEQPGKAAPGSSPLGEEPPRAANPGGGYGSEASWQATLLGRNDPVLETDAPKRKIVFGEYVSGDLYLPPGNPDGEKLPLVIYLPPPCYAMGYIGGYAEVYPPEDFLKRGFAVFSFDPIATGGRIEEGTAFFRRYPRWTLLGKEVRDVRDALDALSRRGEVDPKRIFVAGYGEGGTVALHAMALDTRIAGGMAVCGSPDSALLARLAPRPLLLVSHARDRFVPLAGVEAAVEKARSGWAKDGFSDRLVLLERDDFRRFTPELQRTVLPAFARVLAQAGYSVAAPSPVPAVKVAPESTLESWEVPAMKWAAWDQTVRIAPERERATAGHAALRLYFDFGKYGWPDLYGTTVPAMDLSGAGRLLVDVDVPPALGGELSLIVGLTSEGGERKEPPPIPLKPGWNTVSIDLGASSWLDSATRAHTDKIDMILQSSSSVLSGSVLFDNLRTSR